MEKFCWSQDREKEIDVKNNTKHHLHKRNRWERSGQMFGERCCFRLFRWPSARHRVYLQKPSISHFLSYATDFCSFLFGPKNQFCERSFTQTRKRKKKKIFGNFCVNIFFKSLYMLHSLMLLPPIVKFIWAFKYNVAHYLFAKFLFVA